VHPVFRKRLSVLGLGLGDFIFMMRKGKVLSASVYIDRFRKVFLRHGRTFDMPTRPSHAPVGIPRNFVFRLSRFPKSKIQRVVFLFGGFYPCAKFKFFYILLRQFPVSFKFFRAVIDVAVNLICISFVYEPFHKFNNLRHTFCDLRVYVRFLHVKRRGVFIIFFYIFFADFFRADAFFFRPVYDLIIDVGKVLNELYILPPILQIFS
jgi:hypothetical protein